MHKTTKLLVKFEESIGFFETNMF